MDFAFVPGTSSYEDLLRRVMTARKNTKLISKAGVATIADFFQEMVSSSLKADNILLGAHASDESFAIGFDSTTKVPANSNGRDFEMLQALDTAGTLHIPQQIKNQDDIRCHIKGCNVGADSGQPFLQLLKKVLGNPLQVTGPKFFHDLKDDKGAGVLEYMRVEYVITATKPFSSIGDLVDAFRNANFQQGVEDDKKTKPVPDHWKDWINKSLQLNPTLSDEKTSDFGFSVVPQAGNLKVLNLKSVKCTSHRQGFVATLNMGTQTIPPDNAGRMALLKPLLQGDSREQSDFPLHARFGFPDVDAWIAGFDWTPVADDAKAQLLFIGNRWIYSVRMPVTERGTFTIIYNYYPSSGGPTMNFDETNKGFVMFGTA